MIELTLLDPHFFLVSFFLKFLQWSWQWWVSLVVAWAALCITASAEPIDLSKLKAIDEVIATAIEGGEIPGAVLWLESKGEVVQKAYGNRMVWPGEEPMTMGTVFDVASLTKVLATTPAILLLAEEGLLDLDTPVSKHIPEFLEGGVREKAKDEEVTAAHREGITVRHLLTHQSGLPPSIYLSERDFWGHEEGVHRAATIGLLETPGTRFRYSDVNFVLLGEIVKRVSGQRLDSFADDYFFGPLKMRDTGFVPLGPVAKRVAPTTKIAGYGLIRAEVHDPTARRMQGVSGHAGLFSTAEDVAKMVRMLINGGQSGESQILEPETIAEATQNHLPAELGIERALGWDISSPYAYQRGEKFPREGFGHTGWTGTSIWVDPASETFVILLTNRNHPAEGTNVKPLRIEVGTLAAEAVGYTKLVPLAEEGGAGPQPAIVASGGDAVVLNGIDILERDGFSELAGMKIGLITNQTGINRQRRSTIDLLASAPGVDLVSLFSPEHGIRGVLEQDSVDDDTDKATGLPIYSLYKSENRKPTPEQLKGLDAVIFDIQDIGCRFYTYISTMGLAMEAAGDAGVKFMVLDRVNPIGAKIVDGPVRSGEGNDFVAFHDIPVQHGMTVGELARMFQKERKIDVQLQVIPIEGWNPGKCLDESGLPWINPSPNIRSVTEAMLYPGVGLIEFTNVSVGRGTATPFEHIGAPWIHEGRLVARLREENVPGILFLPTRFTPNTSVYDGEDCGGVKFLITDRDAVRPLDLGLALMRSLHDLHPNTFSLAEKGNILLRHEKTLQAALELESKAAIREGWDPELDRFLKRRKAFLLYSRD